MRPSRGPGVPMPDPALRLVVADALVARLRARVDGWDFDDMAHQRDTLAWLIEAEERVALLRGVNEWADLPELRERLAEVSRWVEERERATDEPCRTAAGRRGRRRGRRARLADGRPRPRPGPAQPRRGRAAPGSPGPLPHRPRLSLPDEHDEHEHEGRRLPADEPVGARNYSHDSGLLVGIDDLPAVGSQQGEYDVAVQAVAQGAHRAVAEQEQGGRVVGRAPVRRERGARAVG